MEHTRGLRAFILVGSSRSKAKLLWSMEHRRRVHAMDSALGRLMRKESAGDRWLICRNTPKYRAKVDAVTRDSELRAVLCRETTSAISDYFGEREESSAIASFDIGHVRIPYVFERCVLTARRHTAVEPIHDAMVSWDPLAVSFERKTFQQLFRTGVRSPGEERDTLIAFVNEALFVKRVRPRFVTGAVACACVVTASFMTADGELSPSSRRTRQWTIDMLIAMSGCSSPA